MTSRINLKPHILNLCRNIIILCSSIIVLYQDVIILRNGIIIIKSIFWYRVPKYYINIYNSFTFLWFSSLRCHCVCYLCLNTKFWLHWWKKMETRNLRHLLGYEKVQPTIKIVIIDYRDRDIDDQWDWKKK